MSFAGKAVTGGRHNVTIHGGKKLGMIKSTATGIEVDIDGLGQGVQAPVAAAGPNDALPPWLRDQLPEPDKMTLADLDKLKKKGRKQDTMNVLFSSNPQGAYQYY